MNERNPFLNGLVSQLILSGASNEVILEVVTDKVRPLTDERIDAFRAGLPEQQDRTRVTVDRSWHGRSYR